MVLFKFIIIIIIIDLYIYMLSNQAFQEKTWKLSDYHWDHEIYFKKHHPVQTVDYQERC